MPPSLPSYIGGWSVLLSPVLWLVSGTSADHMPFVTVPGGLLSGGTCIQGDAEAEGVPFDPSWLTPGESPSGVVVDDGDVLPARLPVPGFVEVYEFSEDEATGEEMPLEDLGVAAREVFDGSRSDAVLFRNLHSRIRSASDFAEFWRGCCRRGPGGWTPVEYVPTTVSRAKLDGVDLATNIPPQFPLACHNEMVYNPRPAGRIAFFCLRDAEEGGETLVARNADLTRAVRTEIQDLVRRHGGVMLTRKYRDESKMGGADSRDMSWQEKCGTRSRKDAIKFFLDLGFSEDLMNFDENGTFTVTNRRSGFTPVDVSGKGDALWFNILRTGMQTLADGTLLDPGTRHELTKDEWSTYHAFKLRPGDWLVLNNNAIQHGRLPYIDSPERRRTILTVYTD